MNAELIPATDEVQRPSTALTTPSDLLAMAVSQGADLDKLERLMELKERHEANEARKAFNEAVAAFKANPPEVFHNRTNKQYNSTYSTLANLVNTVNASLSPHGLNARWDVDQGQQIKVTCILSHALGHSESVSLSGPPDDSGAKNKLQQIRSTLTYLRAATFEAVTGVATIPGNLDDDGNAAGKRQPEKTQGTQGADAVAKRKAVHDAAFGRHSESIAYIKQCIERDEMVPAMQEWAAIPEVDQMALWIATTKGGCLTTAEREKIKNAKTQPKKEAHA